MTLVVEHFDGPHGLSECYIFRDRDRLRAPLKAALFRDKVSFGEHAGHSLVEIRDANEVVVADAFIACDGAAETRCACQWLLDICSATTGLEQCAVINYCDFI